MTSFRFRIFRFILPISKVCIDYHYWFELSCGERRKKWFFFAIQTPSRYYELQPGQFFYFNIRQMSMFKSRENIIFYWSNNSNNQKWCTRINGPGSGRIFDRGTIDSKNIKFVHEFIRNCWLKNIKKPKILVRFVSRILKMMVKIVNQLIL